MSARGAAESPERPQRRKRRRRWPLAVGGTVLLFAGGYLLGFFGFVADIERPHPLEVPRADGIVALTGGPERLDAAFGLLEQRKAQRLLVSGVHPEVTKAALANLFGDAGGRIDCCVDLGREAEDTVGNAAEAARWAEAHGYRSVIVVTSAYHMPRALLELRRAMPGTVLVGLPVFQETVHIDRWWAYPGTARLLIAEYTKYLLALTRAGNVA